METTDAPSKVALLRLQEVQPLCEKAIEQFRKAYSAENDWEIKTVERPARHVYAWIDSTLFVNIIVSLLKDITRNQHDHSDISIQLNQIGNSTCRIVVSDCDNPDLSKCDGPFTSSDIPTHNDILETIEAIITMHGGYMRAWRNPNSTHYYFEINLICMSDSERGTYDTYEA